MWTNKQSSSNKYLLICTVLITFFWQRDFLGSLSRNKAEICCEESLYYYDLLPPVCMLVMQQKRLHNHIQRFCYSLFFHPVMTTENLLWNLHCPFAQPWFVCCHSCFVALKIKHYCINVSKILVCLTQINI